MISTLLLGCLAGLAYNAMKPASAFGTHAPRRHQHKKPKGSPYTIKSGDTLSSIAARETGRAGNWTELYKANYYQIMQEQQDRGCELSPDTIFVGTRIVIPTKLVSG